MVMKGSSKRKAKEASRVEFGPKMPKLRLMARLNPPRYEKIMAPINQIRRNFINK